MERIHPFIALILIAMGLGLSMGLGGQQTVEVLLKGFSETLRWIAIIIILGAFIGEVLQETGGALRISNNIVKWVGEKRLPWAMGFTGYLVSIPVFVDVAYILLQPVVESLAVKSKKPVLYLGLALAAGLTVAHTLIPPNSRSYGCCFFTKIGFRQNAFGKFNRSYMCNDWWGTVGHLFCKRLLVGI